MLRRASLFWSLPFFPAFLLGAAAPGTASAEDLSLPDRDPGFASFAFIEQDVVVPIPSEIFHVLTKFDYGRPDWRAQLQTPSSRRCRDRPHTALYLGSVVADGFLAVQAEDAGAVREIGRVVLDLAEALGLRDSVLRHTKSILAAADDSRWDTVRDEFDATRQTVRDVMTQRRDQDLAHCVSIGGWLRGTEIVTAMIQRGYTAEKGEILHQPRIIEQFSKAIAGMEEDLRDSSRMQTISREFPSLQRLMSSEDALALEEVQRIHTICQELGRSAVAP